MTKSTVEKADYGNWVPTKLIAFPVVLSLIFAGLSFLLPVLIIVAIFLLVCSFFFGYARHLFSAQGGDIQTRVQNLVVHRLADWDGAGKVLDIGCGNGPLTVETPGRYPRAEVVGIDY